MSIRLRPDEDHDALASEFCADYKDRFGKWHPGFHCPSEDGSPDVYCCGTDAYKYCCTKKEVLHPSHISELAILIGILCGAIFAVTLITIFSCFFCRCCLLYKRRHPTVNGGPLYQMHCSSTASGVANMYSFSNQNSSATTPIDANGPGPPLVDLDYVTEGAAGVPLSELAGGCGGGGGIPNRSSPSSLHHHHHHHRTSNSFATVDLIPSSAKMEHDHRECENHQAMRMTDELGGSRLKDDNPDDDDHPPPYEAHVGDAAVAEEPKPDFTATVTTTTTTVTITTMSPNELPQKDQTVPVTTSASNNQPTDKNQVSGTPSNDETLYWSTKF